MDQHPKTEQISFQEWLVTQLAETDAVDAIPLWDWIRVLKTVRKVRGEQRKRLEEKAHQAKVACIRRRELPVDWSNSYIGDIRVQGVHAESAGDGLLLSLGNLGRVDIEYIANITGLSCSAVLDDLAGAIYQNPETWAECFYQGWETADEYLFGALLPKLRAARAAAARWPGLFERNIRALEAVLPSPIPAEGIYVTLGSPWLPPDIIDAFIVHLFGALSEVRVVYDPVSHHWSIRSASLSYNKSLYVTYGSKKCNGLMLLEKTLNAREIKETELSLREKQKKMRREFARWIFADAERSKRLISVYNEKFGYVRKRRYDGSFLSLTGMSSDIALRPYQKNAVARIVLSGNTLLGHEVGAGKTFIMIAAGMELRRTGRSCKNLFVVPNNLVGQWRNIFLRLYPSAKVLCVEPGNFTPRKRQTMLANMRDNDFDGIIIAYSCAEQIPLSVAYREKRLREALDAVKKHLTDPNIIRSKHLDRIQMNISKEIEKLADEIQDTFANVTFDTLGINAFFLDEAHNYKNIPLKGAVPRTRGINPDGSKKCADMLARAHSVQDAGGIAVLATATPVSNSLTDVYTLQQYLQPGALRFLGLEDFGCWARSFAEAQEVFEIDVDTQRFRKLTRFVRFHNLPELGSVFGQVADFGPEVIRKIPEQVEREDRLIMKTPALGKFLEHLSLRADMVRSCQCPLTADNMLKITTDGRKAALDLRLVQSPLPPDPMENKARHCAENVFGLWLKYAETGSVQLVFCDLSVPKSGFNLYGELKKLLMGMGIPEDEIAFVHDHDTPARREKLYALARAGKVRVLIGSTFKLGLGVNIQTRLVALHHLDVPWRPADMLQREGRMLREGNSNNRVHIFRYVTEGSFDAYTWQILETKQRFIARFLSGALNARSGAELDGTVLSYAEVKALAVGDPLLRERIEAAIELERLRQMRMRWHEEHDAMRQELLALPDRRAACEARLRAVRLDMELFASRRTNHTPEERRALGGRILEAQAVHVGMPTEKILCVYEGFNVVLPAGMLPENPGLQLTGNGRYYVKTGGDASGCVIRMDNRLNSLSRLAEDYVEELEKLDNRLAGLEQDIGTPDPYAKAVERAEKHLASLDRALKRRERA